jgi:ankyrin repeat protein
MNSIYRQFIDAIRENNLPEVNRLLRAGADIEAKNTFGDTALIAASTQGNVQVVQAFLEHGADIEARTICGDTSLHCACARGYLTVAIELLSPKDSNGSTPPSILDKRKSRGADTEAKNKGGSTPLHYASMRGHVAVVKALLSRGANILAANNRGKLPVHYAVIERKSAVSKYLFQKLYATTRRLPLHELVDDLTYVVHPGVNDVPPLYEALDRNVLGTDDVVDILEYLVERNPSLLSSRGQDGALPLHVACRRGASFTIIQSLVNGYKASVKSVTAQGDLPLFLACEMPKTSLDTIFILMKLYPDLVYRSFF